MSEAQPEAAPGNRGGATLPELDPRQLEQLTEMVYRLLRDEVLLELERRGAPTIRDRR